MLLFKYSIFICIVIKLLQKSLYKNKSLVLLCEFYDVYNKYAFDAARPQSRLKQNLEQNKSIFQLCFTFFIGQNNNR